MKRAWQSRLKHTAMIPTKTFTSLLCKAPYKLDNAIKLSSTTLQMCTQIEWTAYIEVTMMIPCLEKQSMYRFTHNIQSQSNLLFAQLFIGYRINKSDLHAFLADGTLRHSFKLLEHGLLSLVLMSKILRAFRLQRTLKSCNRTCCIVVLIFELILFQTGPEGKFGIDNPR